MERWMRELGLVMNIRDLGVTEDMLEGIAKGSFILDGGYKKLTQEEIVDILKESMRASNRSLHECRTFPAEIRVVLENTGLPCNNSIVPQEEQKRTTGIFSAGV